MPRGVTVRVRPSAPYEQPGAGRRLRYNQLPAEFSRRARSGEKRFVLELYLPILIFITIGVAIGVVSLAASYGIGGILGVHRPDSEKSSPYECGFEAFEDARMKFDVRYYLVAILFIIFDLEIAFFFPWAVVLDKIGVYGFWAMMVFLGILVVGFIYEWRKGALEWE